MKTLSAVAVSLALIAVAGVCRNMNRLNVPLTELTSSAYQDGSYLGRIAAKNDEALTLPTDDGPRMKSGHRSLRDTSRATPKYC